MASFGVHVDDSELNRLDKKIESGKQRLAAFAGYAATAFAAGAYGAYRMVDAASHADEALNVLTRTFGKQADTVLEWSKEAGDVMGRSMYDLQKSVGEFGAFFGPQFAGGTEDVAAMSQRLTALSVDLASFYNVSDQEASMRVFSGLAGETEAVRRWGVDISDTSLDDFNKKFGDDETKHKRMAALSLQEKTLLRYRKILKDTEGKWNDAALTAGSWANQLKKLHKEMHELAVTLGRELIPFAKQLLKGGHVLVDVFKTLTLKTDGLRDAFIALAAAGVVTWIYSVGAAIASSGLIGTFAQLAYGLERIVLAAGGLAGLAILEDVASFLQGKETITGDLITNLTGMQRPLQAVTDLAEDYAAHLMNALAAARALANPTLTTSLLAGGKSFLDILGGFGYKNVQELGRTREQGRADTFQQSATTQGGKLDYANAPNLTEEKAVETWRDMHAAAIANGALQATPSDVAQGMATQDDLIRAPVPAAPVAWKGSMAPTDFRVVPDVHITINGAADPMETGIATTAAWKKEQMKAKRDLQRANDRAQGAGTQ